MAGISVPQYDVFKIGTSKLKAYGWNLNITKKEAFPLQELVSLFEAQYFRLMAEQILKQDIRTIDFSKIFCQIVIDNKVDFKRATSKKGVIINGETFRRFVGTTGGLKNDSLIFCNVKYLDELNKLCECNRNADIKLVPAKYEAYKALTCSASQQICNPNGILVVPDCFTHFKADVIELDDGDTDEPVMTYVKDKELKNNASDGFNICTIDYMQRVGESLGLNYTPRGVCLRNAWLKGMMYAFPIKEFMDKYNNGNYMVTDVWGNEQDITKCDLILTESSLKLWSSYSSIEDYEKSYHESGYNFAVTKIVADHLENQRELNYQYLQSYDLSDEDIAELCAPTVKWLKESMGSDYQAAMKFLGITENIQGYTWQRALYESEYMLKDPYIMDSIHRMIKKKVNDAKIGKLIVNGNYQLASGDPFALMQSICGLEVTGLLAANECYSKYWIDKDTNDVVIFRSPMTAHNNIRKCTVNSSDECQYWYQYMDTVMIINSWDTFCMAENGCDYDGDLLYSTNNSVLTRNFRQLPAIDCIQKNAEKVVITEKEILRSNKNGMGNDVGTVTNHVTSMMGAQAHYPIGSKEYDELNYRICCGQLYQQATIDKIKGIISKPMPAYWYNIGACSDNKYNQSICASRKPYFFIYIYDETRQKYKNYVSNENLKCMLRFNCSIEELQNKADKTEDEQDFLFWYNYKMPVELGACAMNKICRHIENEMDGWKSKLKSASDFDYTFLKVKHRCTDEHRNALRELEQYYRYCVKEYKKSQVRVDNRDGYGQRITMIKLFKEEAYKICPNEEELMNIILDMTYQENGNKQFCWDIIGELIVNKLISMKGECECIF